MSVNAHAFDVLAALQFMGLTSMGYDHVYVKLPTLGGNTAFRRLAPSVGLPDVSAGPLEIQICTAVGALQHTCVLSWLRCVLYPHWQWDSYLCIEGFNIYSPNGYCMQLLGASSLTQCVV